MSLHKITTFVLKWIAVFMMLGITGTAYGQHDMHQNNTPLTEPGNDVFGTIQEVVQKLEANPDTDWSEVNLEALRQHLLDMKAFTEEVEVVSKREIENGVEIMVKPNTERAEDALNRLLKMHPTMLKKEKSWDMQAEKNEGDWIVRCTTDIASEVKKIRALGYIGLLAEGAHHQRHHWMIATGQTNMEN
ncbi:hypothetical protein CK503_15730 [Aliifodinibius salipaludis]|uniref:Uncharacterized protein n=1 Tax=Fodinibius salipaludis TaxID=2032627 RepID=A0A2A2G673_9BACT|nr:hypothetical protein [Aliifodinibius salipaludis]PAU92640.1 hypothetical protein CK503_15730 [Aliifodinibius salipaludis]